VASKVTQNADLTSKIEEVKSVVSSFSVSSEEITEDTGAFKVSSADAIKTITTAAGVMAKVVLSEVEKAEERTNVVPSSIGAGYSHKNLDNYDADWVV
jgi:hypothetical protein